MGWCAGGGDKLDQDIFDALADFIGRMMQRGDQLAQRYGVPVSCVKALRKLAMPVSMKELGLSLHCDPSFVTMIADALEARGLARREPNAVDRRIKNLALTDRGVEIKAEMEQTALAMMPWTTALDTGERAEFLRLIRKMTSAMEGTPEERAAKGATNQDLQDAEEVSGTAATASAVEV